MSLRDLKPGDRGSIEFEVIEHRSLTCIEIDGLRQWLDGSVNVTKLPPRARPVRKGDEIALGRVAAIYVGTFDLFRIAWDPLPSSPFVINRERNWTHADGTPIDWEASE